MDEQYFSQLKDVTLPSSQYVLVLPGWYPTWQDRLPGDFNERHVKAAGLYTPQVVLYIGKDQTRSLTKVETRYKQCSENIVEIIVIYPEKSNKLINPVHSNLAFIFLLNHYANIISNRWGKPQLIHSYIVIRGGFAGLILSKKWKVPFILSENWTIYYPEDPGYLLKRNKLFRWVVKLVFANVNRFLPVTNRLKQQVYSLLKRVPSTIIPNVVETDYFCYNESVVEEQMFRFVHISTMVYQKNPKGLLRGFKKFNDSHASSCLWMVGPYPADVLKYAREIGLNEDIVHFTGSVSYKEVAQILATSNALVLFSRYENLPCVILEALCCGLPVISTDVGGIPEVIDVSNGILVKSENEAELTSAFIKMYRNFKNYDRREISEYARMRFSYQTVGGLINSVYTEIKNGRDR